MLWTDIIVYAMDRQNYLCYVQTELFMLWTDRIVYDMDRQNYLCYVQTELLMLWTDRIVYAMDRHNCLCYGQTELFMLWTDRIVYAMESTCKEIYHEHFVPVFLLLLEFYLVYINDLTESLAFTSVFLPHTQHKHVELFL